MKNQARVTVTAAPRVSPRRSAALRDGLQVIGAAEERADAFGGELGVGCHQTLDALPAGVDRDRAALAEALDHPAIDVRHQVAEAVDAEHDTAHGASAFLGQRK